MRPGLVELELLTAVADNGAEVSRGANVCHRSTTIKNVIDRRLSERLLNAVSVGWHHPEDVKASYPKASILKTSRVVFNIKGNDYRLVAAVQYRADVLAVRFFGNHAEHEKIDAETV